MGDSKLKVTDKRMFTPDGELREAYRHLEDAPAAPPAEADEPPVAEDEGSAAAAEGGETSRSAGSAGERAADDREQASVPADEAAGAAGGAAAAQLFPELVAMLAEPAALYLGDAQLPDGRSMEDPRMARLHIDLLATLQDKTRGNLDPQESAMLENVLYQLRVRYVQKHGPGGG